MTGLAFLALIDGLRIKAEWGLNWREGTARNTFEQPDEWLRVEFLTLSKRCPPAPHLITGHCRGSSGPTQANAALPTAPFFDPGDQKVTMKR